MTVKSHSIPPARVQHLRVRNGTDVPRDPVVAETLEKIGGSRPEHLDLREGGLVEERRRFPAGTVLDPDRRRPEPSGPAARAQFLVAGLRVRLEPVGPFPAGLLSERSLELL